MLVVAGLAAFSSQVAAEGSRNLHPSTYPASGARAVMDLSGGTTYGGVATSRQFLYVYAQAGEYILLGSRNRVADGATEGPIRLYGPRIVGAPVGSGGFGPKGNEGTPAALGTPAFICDGTGTGGNGPGRGLIPTRAAELARPSSADGSVTAPDSWTPCYYVAPTTGVYGVYFSGASTGSPSTLARRAVDPPAVISANAVSAWDITVRSAADTRDDLDGRVFTFNWTMYLVSNGANFRLHNTIYIVTGDGYRYSQALRGIDPNRAAFYANSKGLIDAGNPLYHDFRGTNASATGLPSGGAGGGNITYQLPEYPIFFSDVDPSVAHNAEVNRVLGELAIPTVPAAPILLPTPAPTFVGNVSGNQSNINVGGTFTFSTQNTLTYEIVIRRGATGPGDTPPNCVSDYDPANPCNRVLTGTALTGSHAVLWDGRDNSGNPFPVGNFDAQIVGRNGEVHFPMADVEANFYGGPTLTKLNGNFAGGSPTTVYYDDRGYRAANGFLVGVLNGHLCGATSPISQPAPTHSLVGVDSADPNLAGPGKYYRWWTGTSDTNTDCAASANEFFGTAKTLDLWALEKTVEYYPEIEIIDAATGVDVGTAVAVSPLVLPGDTAYGTFTFYNAGDTTATGVTYGVTIGNPSLPATCPASVNITVPNPPPGITYTYNPVTCVVTLNNMPGSLAPGQTLGFSFNYVVAPANPGPIPVNTTISAGNETCVIVNDCAPNQAQAITNIAKPVINVSKSSVPAPGTNVLIGDTITYTLTVNISNAPLTGNLVLTDTLGPGLSFGSVTANPGSHFTPDVSNAPLLEFVLPTGKGIGTYTITYTAIVNSSAGTTVANQVTAIGGVDPSDPNPPQPTCGPCSLEHDVLRPTVTVSKASNPASGTAVSPGQTITYTVTVVVANAATNEDATITDTLSANQTFGSVTSST
ncbi:isopeptide-forming domain-containing fimbrial protein, partial [Dokdonella sp.]